MSAEEELISSLRAVINEYPGATGSTAALLELKRRLAKYDEAHPAPVVKVRIAVAVSATGKWYAAATDYESAARSAEYAEEMLNEAPPVRVSFVEAVVPMPVVATVQGEVKEPT
jgi:hypothetical protein